MFSSQLWTAKVDSSSLIGEGGESIWDSLVEKLSWKTCHSPHHSWQVTRYGMVQGSRNTENDDCGAAVDISGLLQLQRVVSWSVAPVVNRDAGCRSNSKSCFILWERKGLMSQCILLTISVFHLPVECNCWAQCVCYFFFGFVYIILIYVIDSHYYPFFVFQHINEKHEGRENQNILGLVPSV